MAQQLINLGGAPNDGTGEPLRVGGQKINFNFSELYGLVQAVSQALAEATTTLGSKANIDSPEFSGTPKAPSPAQSDSSTRLATTAFVQQLVASMIVTAVNNVVGTAPSSLNTLKELADAISNDPSFGATVTSALNSKAPSFSPEFTGVPTAPTAVASTNSGQLATTAFVQAAVSALVNGSPAQLDTINELAAALGNDGNFAATVTAALAGKATSAQGAKADSALQPGTPLSALVASPIAQTITLSERSAFQAVASKLRETRTALVSVPLISVNRRQVFGIHRASNEPLWLGDVMPVPSRGPVREAVRSMRNYDGKGVSAPLIAVNRRTLLGVHRSSGEPLWMDKPLPVPSVGAVRDTVKMIRNFQPQAPASTIPLITVNRRQVLSVDSKTSHPLWLGGAIPVPFTGPVREATKSVRDFVGSGNIPVLAMGHRELISIDRSTQKPLWMGAAWPGEASGGGGGGSASGLPFILIAAANAPAKVKDIADYICTGSNDDLVIQQAINDLPTNGTVMDGANHAITGGKRGIIWFSEGMFFPANKIIIPPGSNVPLRGMGRTPWIPIGILTGPSDFQGGTVIYSTDPNGDVFSFPKNSFAQPSTAINMSGIEIRVFNPAANVSGTALNLEGWITGVIQDINVLGDRSTNGGMAIANGILCLAGGSSSEKEMRAVNVYNFRKVGFKVNTTHLMCIGVSAGNIANDSFSTAFEIAPTDDCEYIGLQAFGSKYGAIISGSPNLQLIIDSLHCEATNIPMLVNGTSPVTVDTLNLDSGVAYTGDVTTKVTVNNLVKKDNPSKLAQSRGVATIPSGASSVTWPHSLIGAPKSRSVTPLANPGSQYWATSDAANVTVTLAQPAPTDVPFDIYARI